MPTYVQSIPYQFTIYRFAKSSCFHIQITFQQLKIIFSISLDLENPYISQS